METISPAVPDSVHGPAVAAAAGKIAARWHWRPLTKDLTAHYDSQFCVSFHCWFAWEA